MKKTILVLLVVVASIVLSSEVSWAQCAMCKASVEANLKEKSPGIGLSINDGILYLMVMPYLMFGIFGYLWYKHSQKKKATP